MHHPKKITLYAIKGSEFGKCEKKTLSKFEKAAI